MTSMIADKTRAGLMGPNHVKRLARVESIVKDPTAFTDIQPTLDLDFRNINGAPFVGNLTRATVGGYRQNNKGVLVPTVVNEPVIDFSAGTALGTGFYGAFTQLALWSEDFTNAAWLKTNLTISANATTAPDGAATADKIVPTNTNGQHNAVQSVTLGAVSCTGSVFLKAGELTKARVSLSDNVSSVIRVDVDLSAGTVGAVSAPSGHWTNYSAKIAALANGWYLVSLTGTPDQGVDKNIEVYALDNTGAVSFAGNGADGFYAWGAQLTATAFPVPYVPTTSAAVARNADSMLISGTDFTDFYNPVEGTLFLDAIVPRFLSSGISNLAAVSSATSNEILGLRLNNVTQTLEATGFVGGVATVAIATQVVTMGQSVKFAYAFKLNDFKAALNGTVAPVDTVGGMPTVDRLGVGSAAWSPGSAAANTNIRRLIYFPKALDAATLQRMTA